MPTLSPSARVGCASDPGEGSVPGGDGCGFPRASSRQSAPNGIVTCYAALGQAVFIIADLPDGGSRWDLDRKRPASSSTGSRLHGPHPRVDGAARLRGGHRLLHPVPRLTTSRTRSRTVVAGFAPLTEPARRHAGHDRGDPGPSPTRVAASRGSPTRRTSVGQIETESGVMGAWLFTRTTFGPLSGYTDGWCDLPHRARPRRRPRPAPGGRRALYFFGPVTCSTRRRAPVIGSSDVATDEIHYTRSAIDDEQRRPARTVSGPGPPGSVRARRGAAAGRNRALSRAAPIRRTTRWGRARSDPACSAPARKFPATRHPRPRGTAATRRYRRLGGTTCRHGGRRTPSVLRRDHRELKKVLAEPGTDDDRAVRTRTRLFAQLERELIAHETIEQELFYPALQARPSAAATARTHECMTWSTSSSSQCGEFPWLRSDVERPSPSQDRSRKPLPRRGERALRACPPDVQLRRAPGARAPYGPPSGGGRPRAVGWPNAANP